MAVIENRFVCDLAKPVRAQALKGNVFSLDNLGSRLSVLIYDNGQPATISGSITGNCILPDGSTVNINGSLTTENGGSKAYVDVPQSCLLIPGILKIAIKCTSSSVITTLAAIVANVYMTKTDNVITPSQQIINDWNAEISASLANQEAEISNIKSATNTKMEVYPTAGFSFSGNTANDDPLVMNTNGYVYFRNFNDSYKTMRAVSCDASYSISTGNMLFFDISTRTLSIANNQSNVIDDNHIILLWKHGTMIKGAWAAYYNEYVLNETKNSTEQNITLLDNALKTKANQIGELKNTDSQIVGFQQYTELSSSVRTVNNNKRYRASDGALIDGDGFVAISFPVIPGEKYQLFAGLFGYSSSYAIIIMSGVSVLTTITDSGNTGSEGTYSLTIPQNATEMRLTSNSSAYANSRISRQGPVIETNLKNLDSQIKVVDFVTGYTKTDGKRYGYTDGSLIDATGFSAVSFQAGYGDRLLFKGGLIGTSNSYNILLMNGNTVDTVINNTGLEMNAGIYELTVPIGITEVRLSVNTAGFRSWRLMKDVSASMHNYVGAMIPANGSHRTWVVGAGGISSIQTACDVAEDGDYVFVKSGTYTEQVSIWEKHIHLIGENRDTTILIDHSGYYDTPPLEMNLGSLANMTIIEDGSNPTGSASETTKYLFAYCLHIEANKGSAVEEFLVTNCTFINDIHCPLGCGLYPDYTVHFKNCTFRCNAQNEGDKERGTLYFHTNTNPGVTGQHIIFENCIASTAENRAVYLGVPEGASGTGSADYRFSGCTLWSDVLGESDSIVGRSTTGGTFFQMVHSYGNNVQTLNNN